MTAVALLVVACGTTVEPSATFVPSATPVPPTAVPSQGRFRPMAYPAEGEAPCGQAEAPDAAHAAYTGQIRRISSTDAETVVFELCEPDVAFRSKIAAPAFAINDTGWLESHIDPATSGPQAIVTEVNGTGPYRLESWNHGSEVSLARNDDYWGDAALNERLIVRWYDNPGQRFAELQNATVDGIDDVFPSSVAAVTDDVGLALQTRPGLNVSYLGFTNTFAPFDDERVRRAIAMGIDRQRIVDTLLPARLGAGHPLRAVRHPARLQRRPVVRVRPDPGQGDARRGRLSRTGSTRRSSTATRSRPYLPDPTGVATELKTQLLANLGIRAELVADARGHLPGRRRRGQARRHPPARAERDLPRRRARSSIRASGRPPRHEFGTKFDDIGKALASGRSTTSGGKRDAAYAKANDAIRSHVPMVPIARTATNAAYRADVTGAATSPLRLERFAPMTPGDRRQLVWLATAEPAGLYCADEGDPVSRSRLRPAEREPVRLRADRARRRSRRWPRSAIRTTS